MLFHLYIMHCNVPDDECEKDTTSRCSSVFVAAVYIWVFEATAKHMKSKILTDEAEVFQATHAEVRAK